MTSESLDKRTAIILFAHGSAIAEANLEVARLAENLANRLGCSAGWGFLEIAQPNLGAAIAQAAHGGAIRVVIVPYFLTMGVHVQRDLPRLVEQQRALFPQLEILVAQPLERSPGLPDLLLDRVKEVLP